MAGPSHRESSHTVDFGGQNRCATQSISTLQYYGLCCAQSTRKPDHNLTITHLSEVYTAGNHTAKTALRAKIRQARVPYHKSSTQNSVRLQHTLSSKVAVPCNNHCCWRCCNFSFLFLYDSHCDALSPLTACTRRRSPPFFPVRLLPHSPKRRNPVHSRFYLGRWTHRRNPVHYLDPNLDNSWALP